MSRLWGQLDPEWSAILRKQVRREARRIAKARDCPLTNTSRPKRWSPWFKAREQAGVPCRESWCSRTSGLCALVLTQTQCPRPGMASRCRPRRWLGWLVMLLSQGIEISGKAFRSGWGQTPHGDRRSAQGSPGGLPNVCDRWRHAFGRCEIHHVDEWINSGTPILRTYCQSRLTGITWCTRGGWQLKINPDRTIELRLRRGSCTGRSHRRTRCEASLPGGRLAAFYNYLTIRQRAVDTDAVTEIAQEPLLTSLPILTTTGTGHCRWKVRLPLSSWL